MGILDEAIREHLELKRQHGAADSELKELEDEAFGPPERPKPNIADLQEAPPPAEPAEKEDREAIAEQPTEHFDVEEELDSATPGPSDEELVEEEMDEPRLAPVDPLANVEAVEEIEVQAAAPDTADVEDVAEDEEDEDFWSEQRLSDELDQALDAPLEEDDEPAAETEATEPAAAETEPLEEDEGEGEGDHDVLESTPDFLEDAPEDDELWFEQKPPKDFDFDD